MTEQRRGGEATEPPTPRRLLEARRRGDVPRSGEVTAAAAFMVSSFVIAVVWVQSVSTLGQYLWRSLDGSVTGLASPVAALREGLWVVAVVSAPVLLAALIAAALAGYAQTGSVFSLRAVKPSLSRLDPLRNARNLFGRRALFELIKGAIKLLGIGYIAYMTIRDCVPELLGMVASTPAAVLGVVTRVLSVMVLRIACLVVALAVVDLVYQRAAWRKRLRMTKQEVKREQRESEGDPQHKADRQRVHREIIEHQMFERIATADCVIINPVHVAVAIRYDADQMSAPQVVARGQRLVAARIRQLARRHGVPIVRNVPLARALADLELDQEVPPDLYEAVAEVLRFIQRLQPDPSGTDLGTSGLIDGHAHE